MDRLHQEIAEKVYPIYIPTGLLLKKILWAFERDVGISPPKYFVLHVLAGEGGISQGEIGRLYGVDPSRVTRLAKQLEGEGLIERTRDPRDNRVVRMYLTEEGRRKVGELPRLRERFRERINGVLSDEEVDELRRMLRLLAQSMKD